MSCRVAVRLALGLAVVVAACSSSEEGEPSVTTAEAGSGVAATSAPGSTAGPTTSAGPETVAPTTAVPPSTEPAPPSCSDERRMVVTDIDETLTLADEEFFDQLADPTYVPRARPGAAELMQRYADAGYLVAYVTARPESLTVGDETVRAATIEWLDEQGFPLGEGVARVFLMDTDRFADVREYKGTVTAELVARGWVPVVGYGNVDTDVLGFHDAGVPLDKLYTIGRVAGVEGSVAVAGKGWRRHIRDVVAGETATPFCRR